MKTEYQKVSSAWSKSNALYAKTAAKIGISYSEMMVLYALKTEGNLTQRQVSENFGMQKQTVNGIVKTLMGRGVLRLEASETDRREKRIHFTDEGRAYADRIIDPVLRIEEKVYRMIGEEKTRELYELLDLFNLLYERELDGGFSCES